jgi:hypothetical protein
MKSSALRQKKPDAIAMLSALQQSMQDDAPVVAAAATTALRKGRKPKAGARAGTRLIAGHFPESTLKALKHLMAEEDTTLQALLEEAIHDLLVKKGMAKGGTPRL